MTNLCFILNFYAVRKQQHSFSIKSMEFNIKFDAKISEMAIKVEEVTKLYGEQRALDQVSFTINSGEVVGFLGPNGAGKSTMMKIITGYLQPDSGHVWVNDLPINGNSIEIRKRIGYLPEHNPLYTDLYVREYLRFVAGIYNIKNSRNRIEEIIEMTGLSQESHKKIGSLSKGYRQRVGLAQALIHDPEVLILDEPTSGLDPTQLVEIRQLIRSISANKTVMLSTHIMQEVEALCDRIIVINRGKVVTGENAGLFKSFDKDVSQKIIVEFEEKVDAENLSSITGVIQTEPLNDEKWLITGSGEDIRPYIFRFAVDNNLTILTLTRQENKLENIFLEMVKQK
jgi:ABC-2 type transport system ATP-binding protein